MSEPKTICVACGRTILQRTADRFKGRCAPCDTKAMMTPPPDFRIPAGLAERMRVWNVDFEIFRTFVWRDGVDAMHRLIDDLERRDRLCEELSPRLRAFAQSCREERPAPSNESLSEVDRAKQRVFEKTFGDHPVYGRSFAICSMPLIAIPVARRLWPRQERRMVFLTPDEETRWNKADSHPEDALEWCSHFWWRLDDCCGREWVIYERTFTFEKDLRNGEAAWVVTMGDSYGGQYGCENVDLWSWDGKDARFIRQLFPPISPSYSFALKLTGWGV